MSKKKITSSSNSRVYGYEAEINIPKTEIEKAKAWRSKIEHAQSSYGLKIESRLKKAAEAWEYVHCNFKNKNKFVGDTARYLFPLLKDRHRLTIPVVPTPMVESNTVEHDDIIASMESLLDVMVSSPYSNVQKVIKRLEFDDDFMGVGVGKVVWEQVEVPRPESNSVPSADEIGLEIDKAMEENTDPMSAVVASGDNDDVHYEIHMDALAELEDGAAKDKLAEHVNAHKAKQYIFTDQRPVLKRVKPEDYAYDMSVPWEERSWEAERMSIRIKTLKDMRYKNVNPENCSLEKSIGDIAPLWEDATTLVWDIRDIRNGERLIIPAVGAEPKAINVEPIEVGANGAQLEEYYLLITEPLGEGDGYGVAIATMLTTLLDALYSVDYHIAVHTKNHSNYKTAIRKGTMNTGQKGAMKDPNQIFVELGDAALNGIKEIKPPPIPETLLTYRGILLQEIRRIAGLDAQDIGVDHSAVISATESRIRGDSSSNKVAERQEVAGEFLSWVSRTFLSFYKRYGTNAITLKTYDNGQEETILDPEKIPDQLDVYIDITGETDSRRSEAITNFREYTNYLMSSEQKVNHKEVNKHYGQLLNIKRPNKFVNDEVPAGPENAEQGMGSSPSPTKQPGVPV